jgi:hypothetical protein
MANTRAKPDLRAVTIALVRDHKEAQRLQDKLRSAGIESFLAAERSYALDKSTNRERRAVKIQVGRTDVQRALRALGTANPAAGTRVARPKARIRRPRWLTDGNPIVAVIVIISVIIAALILFLT